MCTVFPANRIRAADAAIQMFKPRLDGLVTGQVSKIEEVAIPVEIDGLAMVFKAVCQLVRALSIEVVLANFLETDRLFCRIS